MTPFDRRLAAALFLTLAGLYLLTSGGHFYASDDLQKLRVLNSLWFEGDFTILEGWAKGGWVNGVLMRYSWFPLGASVAMVPGWALGHLAVSLFPMLPAEYVVRFAVSIQNTVISAALVSGTFLFARRLGASTRGAGWMALALGLGTMVWPYAKTSWSEPTAALLMLGGLWAAWEGDRASGAMRRNAWLASGVLLAAASSIRQEMALLFIGLAGWLYLRHRRDGATLALTLGVPLVAVTAVALWYNQLRFGQALDFMSYRLPQKNLVMEEGRFGWSLRNVYQYLLSPNQGIVWYSPPILVALAGLRRIPREAARLFACALIPLALFYVFGWGLSSWSWGLRYTYVFLPFLMLGAAFAFDAAPRRRAIAAALLTLGVAVQLVAVTQDFNRLYEDEMVSHRSERLTIQRLMTTPSHAPLYLAVRALPTTLSNGLALIAAPAAPSETVAEYRQRRRHVPDFWFVLQLLSPIPRKLTLAAVLLLAAMTAVAAVWLAVLMRGAATGSHERGLDLNAESAEMLGARGEVSFSVGNDSKRD